MNGLTRFFLVLLRLAIGWLFLFEGVEKLESIWTGPTTQSRPFTSEPYLREASGPLADVVRREIGDLDQEALDYLTPVELRKDQDPSHVPDKDRLSPALAREWDKVFERLESFYGLDAEQKKQADALLAQAKDQAGRWLLTGSKEVEKSASGSSFRFTQSTPERVAAYRERVNLLRETIDKKLPAFGTDVEKERLRNLKAEVSRIRSELLADLNEPLKDKVQLISTKLLTDDQKKLGPMPEKPEHSLTELTRLEWSDRITPYWVTAVGVCLLLGLFTRTACVAGALFLALLYLTMPPFPGVPTPVGTEGHPYIVTKNLVMCLGLLALATTRSGRWVGLDGILYVLNPFRRGRAARQRVVRGS